MNPTLDGRNTEPELVPLHQCHQVCGGKTNIIMEAYEAEAAERRKADSAKKEAELKERQAWSQAWRQRRKEEQEERLRQQQAEFQQE
eukprot:9090665-Alexandrium_andersonii.AAC.1